MWQHGGQFFTHAQQHDLSPTLALETLIDLSASINPNLPDTRPRINAALWRHYPVQTDHNLLALLANKFQLESAHIRLTNGISSAILALFAHFRPDITVLYTPIYSEYQRAAQTYSRKVIQIQRPLACTNQQACLNDLLSQPVAKNSWIVWVNPATPDGSYWTPNALRPLLQHWREQGCWVLMDESFLPFLGFDSHLSLRPLIADWPNLIILQSLTKYYACPGLRVGAVFAHPDVLTAWPQPAWPISSFDSDILSQALSDSAFDAHTQRWLHSAKADLVAQLNAHPLINQVLPSAANFVLAHTRPPAQTLAHALSAQAIFVRPCDSFGLGAHFVRIALHSPPIHRRLIHALNQLSPHYQAENDAVI
ncbi:MAG: aminotransferase class I/II-fold pyridoxal phosphate-dependent enzyme [Thiomicrospira sp.]